MKKTIMAEIILRVRKIIKQISISFTNLYIKN